MSYITTCSRCSALYEEQSSEAADAPDRLCYACFKQPNDECRCERVPTEWEVNVNRCNSCHMPIHSAPVPA